jgi:hypothetical protein
MTITLPSTPGPRRMTPMFQDFGGNLTPALGGSVQRINRLGSRWAFAVEMPPMAGEPDGRIWARRLTSGKQEGVLMAIAQPGLVIGEPGSPVVDGAGQSGSALALRGLAAGHDLVEGQFVSIVAAGRRYVHMICADVSADGAGELTAAITPLLRVSPADGAVVEIAQPYVEGLLDGDGVNWTVDIGALFGHAFTIKEAR